MLYMGSIKIYVYIETLERLGKIYIKLLRETLLGKMKGRVGGGWSGENMYFQVL